VGVVVADKGKGCSLKKMKKRIKLSFHFFFYMEIFYGGAGRKNSPYANQLFLRTSQYFYRVHYKIS